jgi:flagellar basal body-associated protein FliL
MPQKTEKKPEVAAAPAPETKEASKGGVMSKTPVLMGGVMVVEALVLIAGFKMLGGAGADAAMAEAVAVHLHTDARAAALADRRMVEVHVLDFRATNKLSGRTFLYDVSIFILSRQEHEEKLKLSIREREALIKDRIRTIIAQSDPEKLGGGTEPGLETLRRQVKYQLDEIIGEGMIDEVLVPRCIPFRVDF